MALECPKCGAGIDQDFGMIPCPSCGSVLSIDFDGNISVADDPVPEPEAPEGLEITAVPGNTQIRFQTQQFVAEPEFELPTFEVDNSTQPLPEELTPEGPPVPEPSSLEQDVTEFAKRDSSAGVLSYAIKVSGIDTKQIRQAVLGALSDSRFGFTQKSLQSEISNGELHLRDLTPGQAVMVVRKLRPLPVQLDWSQNAI